MKERSIQFMMTISLNLKGTSKNPVSEETGKNEVNVSKDF
jgi:hypothetical protein